MKFKLFIIIILLLGFVIFSLTGVVSKQDLTRTRIKSLGYEISQYIQKGGSVNNNILKELPKYPRKDNSVADGWGRPFILEINNENIFLISYGRDGLKGGADKDKDFMIIINIISRKIKYVN